MIPELTMIISVYCIVRLLEVVAKEKTNVVVMIFAIGAIAIIGWQCWQVWNVATI
jgi:hypothetical protein